MNKETTNGFFRRNVCSEKCRIRGNGLEHLLGLFILCGMWCCTSASLFGIDYGQPVPEGEHPAVGMVVVDLGEKQTSLGTGTLIGRNVVLTAAHVIQDALSPGHIVFRAFLGGGRLFQSRVVVYRTHPGYINLRSDSLISDDERTYLDVDMLSTSATDIAILLLEKPLPQEIPVCSLAENDPDPNQEATAIGFGLDEGKQSGNPRKLSGTLQYLKVQDGSLLFRTPSGSKQRTDHGDSGGPLLIKQGGQQKIVAITHGFFTAVKVDGLAPDEYGIYVSIPSQREWILETQQNLERYKTPQAPWFYLARNTRRSPFLALTARQVFSLANSDTPIERLVGRVFVRGINEPIPGDVAVGWQKRYQLPPGVLIPVKTE